MIDKWLANSNFSKRYEAFIAKHVFGKISANKLTIIGLIFGLLCSITIFLANFFLLIAIQLTIIASIFMALSFFIDTLDGAVARLSEPTIFGGILDIFCDRLVEISIIVSIVSTDTGNLFWPAIFSLGAMVLCISMFLLVGSILKPPENDGKKKVISYSMGMMERSETLIMLFLLVLLLNYRAFLLWLFSILVFITALLRLYHASKLFHS